MRITTAYGGIKHVGEGRLHLTSSPHVRPSESVYKLLSKPEPMVPEVVTVGDETIPYTDFLARLGGV